MRLLCFVERFWPYIGGAEVHTSLVLPALVRRGFEITVVTSRDGDLLPEQDEFEGVGIRRYRMIESIWSHDVEEIAKIRRQIAALREELEPDVVHLHFTGPAIYFAVMTAQARPAPTILSLHGSWPQILQPRAGLLQRAIDESAWLTGCSDSALADLRALDPTIAERSSTVLYGLDPPALEPSRLSFEPPVLLCAARLSHEKGIDLAIEAFALVREHVPGARLRIAGDGPERESLVALVERLGLRDAVEFLGWSPPGDTPRLIDGAAVVLIPSRLEGFGLTALEGMLGARPVVAFGVGGLPEVLGEDGGVLVDPGDPTAFADAIIGLLLRPELATKLAAAARERARTRFPLRACVDAYEDIYRKIAAPSLVS